MMPKWTAVLLLPCIGCSGSRAPVAADREATAAAVVSAADVRAAVGTDCLTGEWTMMDHGRTRAFRFRADHTGEEVRSATDTRRFVWRAREDGTVRVSYPEKLDEDIATRAIFVDCADVALSVAGIRYARRE